jgi:hypothetical protein
MDGRTTLNKKVDGQWKRQPSAAIELPCLPNIRDFEAFSLNDSGAESQHEESNHAHQGVVK